MTQWSVLALAMLCCGCNVAHGWSMPFSNLLLRSPAQAEEVKLPSQLAREEERRQKREKEEEGKEVERELFAWAGEVLGNAVWFVTTAPLSFAADVALLPVTVPHDLMQPRHEPVPFRPMYAPAKGPSPLEAPMTDRDAPMAYRAELERNDWTICNRLLLGGTWLDDPSSVAASDHFYAEFSMVATPPASMWAFETGLGIGSGTEQIDPAPRKVRTTLADFTVGGRLTGSLVGMLPHIGAGLGLGYASSHLNESSGPPSDDELLGIAYVRAGVDFFRSSQGWSIGLDVRHSFASHAELFGSNADLDHTQACFVISRTW